MLSAEIGSHAHSVCSNSYQFNSNWRQACRCLCKSRAAGLQRMRRATALGLSVAARSCSAAICREKGEYSRSTRLLIAEEVCTINTELCHGCCSHGCANVHRDPFFC